MLWIFGIVAVSLLVINVQILVLFQRRANELRGRQETPRRRIHEHVEAMRDAAAKVRALVGTRMDEMTFVIDRTRQQAEVFSRAIAGLEQQTETPDDERPANAAPSPAQAPAAEGGDKGPDKEAVRQVRMQQEEIGGHLTSMRREMEIVRRSMERVQGRMQRYQGGSKGSQ